LIRKYLILGKHIQLSSTKHDLSDSESGEYPVEIKLPIETFWKAEEMLKLAEYQLSSGEDPQTVKDTYSKILRLLAPHCITEKDRALIYDKIT
jgi:hypothetical protein